MRSIIGKNEFKVHVDPEAEVADLLRKVINYYPQAGKESMEYLWDSEERSDSHWLEVHPVYVPRMGWRFLLNGRDLQFEGGFGTKSSKKILSGYFCRGDNFTTFSGRV